MSIEANTYEEIIINNVNDKTANVARDFGEYLTGTWGIISLTLNADGRIFEFEDDVIEDGSELLDVCRALSENRSIKASLRSCNGGGLAWRQDSTFLKNLTDDTDLTDNIVYKSIDYYDQDPGVDLCSYGKDGLIVLNRDGNISFDGISDIKEWYCYTPEIAVSTEDKTGDTKLHNELTGILNELSDTFGGGDEDCYFDDWEEYGEIAVSSSVRFKTDSITRITALLNEIVRIAAQNDLEVNIDVCAVPDGEGDYDFASISIGLSDNKTEVLYSRI